MRDETSFEEEILLQTECELYGVDYSVTNFSTKMLAMDPELLKRAQFLQAGVSGASTTKGGKVFYTIKVSLEILSLDWVGFGEMMAANERVMA